MSVEDKIVDIREHYEAELVRAGVRTDNIDYDILEDVRAEFVSKIKYLISEEHTLANSNKRKEEILGVKLEVNPNLKDGQFVLSSEPER